MKKKILLILTYALGVAGLIASVKVARAYIHHNEAVPKPLLADCDDPPPTTYPGE